MSRNVARRRTKKRTNWALRILIVALVAFVALQAVRLCSEIMDTQQQLKQVESANANKESNNESKEQLKNDFEEILENEAHDSGYFRPGQQIFQRGEG